MKILVFDPSGNHAEGNGTTGWAVFLDGELVDFGDVKSSDFTSPEAYWTEVTQPILAKRPDVIVYETYRLRAGKAMEQSWSLLETPQLIGTIRWLSHTAGIPCVGQDPVLKERFNDKILINTKVAEKRPGGLYIRGRRTNMHMRDAIRHGLYFVRYGLKKLEGEK